MEAKSAEDIPAGPQWQYEPKWDGFRCVAFRDGDEVELRSKSGQSLTRYFPEVADSLRSLPARRFVLDGEIVVPVGKALSFDALLMRIHPADSRVRKLAAETPAHMIVFDLLVDEKGPALVTLPLEERRPALEAFAKKHLQDTGTVQLSPATSDESVARSWLKGRGGLDGVIAKRIDLPYRTGDRTGMQKIKRMRTADCVVGGFRYASGSRVIGSMLLGLYDDGGLLHHVGFTSSFTNAARKDLVPKLEKLIGPPGFTGQAPGGPSRWSSARSSEWEPLKPKLVVEVQYDHFSGSRFRHGTRFLRWRPDKAPRQCTTDQVEPEGVSSLTLLSDGKKPAKKQRTGDISGPRSTRTSASAD
ncbi:MAG: ATP-dependent DNA ligase [Gemmatimonadaceae bacterium]|nr:ATP-dependent DNA ligase [Gemmatimonadaceae bacterium]